MQIRFEIWEELYILDEVLLLQAREKREVKKDEHIRYRWQNAGIASEVMALWLSGDRLLNAGEQVPIAVLSRRCVLSVMDLRELCDKQYCNTTIAKVTINCLLALSQAGVIAELQ